MIEKTIYDDICPLCYFPLEVMGEDIAELEYPVKMRIDNKIRDAAEAHVRCVARWMKDVERQVDCE